MFRGQRRCWLLIWLSSALRKTKTLSTTALHLTGIIPLMLAVAVWKGLFLVSVCRESEVTRLLDLQLQFDSQSLDTNRFTAFIIN